MNMINEKDTKAANFICSLYLLIMLDTLLLRLSLHFTPLHYTCWHFTSHLNFTQLHFITLSFGLTPFKFPTPPFHLTSLHFTFRWFSPHFCFFHSTPCIIAFLILFLKILGLQGKPFIRCQVCHASGRYSPPLMSVAWCDHSEVHVGFVVYKVAVGQDFFWVHQFSASSIIDPVLHTHSSVMDSVQS